MDAISFSMGPMFLFSVSRFWSFIGLVRSVLDLLQ